MIERCGSEKVWRYFCFLLIAVSTTPVLATQEGEGSAEKLRLEHAEQASSALVNGKIVRQLDGAVRFRQGTSTMICRRAIQYPEEGRTVFQGSVHIEDGEKSLDADRVTYFEKLKIYEAASKVIARNRSTILHCDRLFYYSEQRKIIALRNVKVDHPDERVQLTAGHAEYYRDTEYVRATENPVFVQFDSSGNEDTRIVGLTMESFERGKRVKVTDDVQIFHGETRAKCQLAEFFTDSSKIVLTVDPFVWQGNDEMRGDKIELYLENRKITEVLVLGNATVVSPPDSGVAYAQPNTLTGQTIRMFVKANVLVKVIVEGTATSVYNVVENGRNKGINRVQGDQITLYIKSNNIDRVVIRSDPGKSNGEFTPPGTGATPVKKDSAGETETRARGQRQGGGSGV